MSHDALEVRAKEGIRALIELCGGDPDDAGMADTPDRVVRAMREMTAGYHVMVEAVLSKRFEVEHSDDLVIVRDIEFVSLCEHHLLPFSGIATVGYLPRSGAEVVGLSKIARTVHAFARRFQTQERMAWQIATTISDELDVAGVGVVINANHSCMSMRGAKAKGSMVTSALYGALRENQDLRAEFMNLIGG